MAEALYRKYRPQVFEEVVGQEHIERTLKNAIGSDKVSHAYLFTGPRGTGKTTTARLLSKALCCSSGPTAHPDGTCDDCLMIAEGTHPDVYELDAASRTGVDNVREEIIGRVNYAPTRGQYKIYIIDEVHMLTVPAFNALLKTLEEPPGHVVFIMCTTDPQKVPETIQSRCQRFDFHRISNEEVVSRLGAICEMEQVAFEGEALELIAQRAEGGMRDALTSLEQLIAFSDANVTLQQAERLLGSLDSSEMATIIQAIGKRDVAACFEWTAAYTETGADLAQFAQDLAAHVRDMYVMSLAGADAALQVSDASRQELQVELADFSTDRLARLLALLADLLVDLKSTSNQRLSFEIALTRMARPESDITLDALAERIAALEQGVPSVTQLSSAQSVSVSTNQSASAAVQTQTPQSQPLPSQSASEPCSKGGSLASELSSSEPAQSVASVAQAAGNLAGSDATQLWESTLSHLRTISPPHAAVLSTGVPHWEVVGEVMALAFDPSKAIAFATADKPETKEVVSKAFAQAGAPGVRLSVVRAGETPETKEPYPVSASTPSPSQAAKPAEVSEPEPVPSAVSIHASEPEPEPDTEPAAMPISSFVPEAATEIEPAQQEKQATSEVDSAASQDQAANLNELFSGAFGEGIQFSEVQ